MSDCYCDYDPAEVYVQTPRLARKVHCCSECGKAIEKGEVYERVFAIWDGEPNDMPMCFHCLSLIEFVKESVPCFCWAHGGLLEAVEETVDYYAHEADGLMFGWLRRKAMIEKRRRPTEEELARPRRVAA